MRTVPIFAGLLSVTAAAAQNLSDTPNKGVIYGTVTANDGAKNLMLNAEPPGVVLAIALPWTKTDDTGAFRFEHLPFGRYTVFAQDNEQGYSSFGTGVGGFRSRSANRVCEKRGRSSKKTRTLGCVRPIYLSNRRVTTFWRGGPMKLLKSVMLLLVLVPALLTTDAKSKKPMKISAAFSHARYVYVEAVDGQEFDPWLLPEDRQAIGDLSDAIYDWNRYSLVYQRDQADLIFVVRKGRLVEGRVGAAIPVDPQVQVGSRPQNTSNRPMNAPPQGAGIYGGGEVGPPDDLLEVYLPSEGERRGTLLWQHTRADGLDAPGLALFKQLKDDVDRTYPAQPATPTSNPTRPPSPSQSPSQSQPPDPSQTPGPTQTPSQPNKP